MDGLDEGGLLLVVNWNVGRRSSSSGARVKIWMDGVDGGIGQTGRAP
jgi:hypothetical protein